MPQVIITAASGITSFARPADWNPKNNTIECVGRGGNGGGGSVGAGSGGPGGGGGAYAIARNVDPTFPVVIAFGSPANWSDTDWGTEFGGDGSGNTARFPYTGPIPYCRANNGVGGNPTMGGSGGLGGQIHRNIPSGATGGFSGGAGGVPDYPAGGGGGGAAGPNGNGGGGGSFGSGNGGAGNGGITPAQPTLGVAGNSVAVWDTYGVGGGGGAGTGNAVPAGAGGSYGGGGGGGGYISAGGAGQPGLIIITWEPPAAAPRQHAIIIA